MALEHALLVALREKPGAGLDLTRRFEKAFGFFWDATHQQIYRVLGRMVVDGLVEVEVVAQSGRPDKKVYRVTETGAEFLADWLATPTPMEPLRSDLAVKMRGATYGDRTKILASLRANRADHRARLEHYRGLERAYDDLGGPAALSEQELDQYLVLRGGVRMEEYWVAWITDYLQAYDPAEKTATEADDMGDRR